MGQGSSDVSDTSDDEDRGYVHDTDWEDAQPLEPRQMRRRGAIGGGPIRRNPAIWERPVPRPRPTQETVHDTERMRAAHMAGVAETLSQQRAVAERAQIMREQYQERLRADARARTKAYGSDRVGDHRAALTVIVREKSRCTRVAQ